MPPTKPPTKAPPISIDRARLRTALDAERADYAARRPRSRSLHEQARTHLPGGVPMNWMTRWPGDFPLFVESAHGAHFRDVDGHDYVDFCLGDTGAMTGHAPPAAIEAITQAAARGATLMLPTEDAIWVSGELARRFGLPYWQFALTATDANRFALRLARHLTGRKLILVFNYCYHGTVDETLITLEHGRPGPRPGAIGPAVNPALTTRVVEFNDIAALEAALAPGDVACVLTEPALTNIGIVHPDPGFHDALRKLTRETGTLLIIDETHTICSGEGGYTRAYGLEPDFLTLGKPIAGGVPAAVYGMSADVAARLDAMHGAVTADVSGIGGTLAGNALSLAAMRATLSEVLTGESFAHSIALAERWTAGVRGVIEAHRLPWHVTQLGCRAEYWFTPTPPRNGGEAAAAGDADLDRYMHLAALNRGILMTPFHNMALMCPATSQADIDRHTDVFAECVARIVG
jgi:glutamate-1-semialdehyde 2,1-aminomutase